MKFLLKPNSIYTRLLTTGLVPLALFSMLMGYYIISSQRTELLESLHSTGQIAVHQVAENSAFALYSGDRARLDSLSYVALEIPSVSGVLFHRYQDDQKIIIGNIGFSVEAMPENFERNSPFQLNGYWYFYSDIVSDRTPVMDYDEISEYEPDRIGWVLLALTDKILVQKERSFIFTTILVVSLGLLMAFWLSIRIGRTVSDPIKSLTTVIGEMEMGDLDRVASEEGIIELSKLASGINGLATSVRQSNQHMQSEISLATKQLKDTLVELEGAMKAKDQFLARMSHELRTPLTAVLGFSNLLFTEDSEQKRQEHLRVIQRCSTVLLTMIDDILDFAKADLSGFTLKNTDFDLDKLIDDLMTLFRTQADEEGLHLHISVEQDVPKKVHGDPVRLAQVLANLLNNAIKFTHVGGIDVVISRVDAENDQVIIKFAITDSGKGIAKDKIPTLFEPFTQEDTSINRRFGGSGLGLSIAKRLVVAMGGDISISSEIGVGSTVIFTCKFTNYGYHDSEVDRGFVPANYSETENILSGVSILLAEDNPFNQNFLMKLLERHGASCLIAKNGLEAIYMAKNRHLDVILMDLHMPVVDGLLATKTIILQNVDSPPIIGLTADITESEQQKLIAAGAVGVQLKPVDELKLINAVLSALDDHTEITEIAGGGMLSSVLPAQQLKSVISDNLDRLQKCLADDEKANLRPIMHDLLGLSGLYGMMELREMILDFKASYGNLEVTQNLQKVKQMRTHLENSQHLN
jgi:two-component system sensor histidine kinase BarA